jgi:hypothetical protein
LSANIVFPPFNMHFVTAPPAPFVQSIMIQQQRTGLGFLVVVAAVILAVEKQMIVPSIAIQQM